jgi:hypothetical protein
VLEHVAEVVVGVRVVGCELDRAPDQGLGLRQPPELKRHHAAEMPGVGIVGRQREDAPIELVGGLQALVLLQLAGVRHRVREPELLGRCRVEPVARRHGEILVHSKRPGRGLLTPRLDRASLAWGPGDRVTTEGGHERA